MQFTRRFGTSLRCVLTAAVLAAFVPGSASAESVSVSEAPRKESKWKKAWVWSAAALLAATAADTATSIGHQELNPMLRGANGQFNGRSAGLKLAVVGGMIGAQYLLVKKSPAQARWAAAANAAGAGLVGATAVRNARLQ